MQCHNIIAAREPCQGCLNPIPRAIFPSMYTTSLPSDLIIMKHKVDIPRPLLISPHKLLVARRPLFLRIAREHRLETDADGFDVVNRRPALAVKQVETNDAVGVDVGVPRDGVGLGADKDYFGGLRNEH